MSLGTFLHSLGHDLATFGKWVEEALPIAGSVLVVVDPPLAPVVTAVETIIRDLSSVNKIPTAAELQQITQAVTLLQSVQTVITNGKIMQGKIPLSP